MPILKVKKQLQQLVNELGYNTDDVDLRFSEHSDASSAVALALAKQANTSPIELAQKIADNFSSELVEKVEVSGPGFLNFSFSKEFFDQSLLELEKTKKFDFLAKENILVEHSSPNLFKPFHIGHLANNSYGEALVRVFRLAGANVRIYSFPSDVSVGIAKAVWAIKNLGYSLDNLTIKQIGKAYTHGYSAYEQNQKAKEEIEQINIDIYNQNSQSPYWEIYQKGKEISLEYFLKITKSLGSKFDRFVFESEAEKVGKELVFANTPEVFKKVESGGYLFEGSKYGLHDDIFVNKFGAGTYLAKDLGLLKIKKDSENFNKSYTLADNEQKSHFALVKKAAELVDPGLVEGVEFLLHGRLSFDGMRLSSRGGAPAAEEFIELVSQKALEKIQESNKDIKDPQKAAENIALSAIKFEILKVSMGKNIKFDTQKALSFTGNSGPYLLYSLVRANSVLENTSSSQTNTNTQVYKTIELALARFPLVVKEAVEKKEPSVIVHYLIELAGAFNKWYAQEKILDNSNSQPRKLQITKTFAHILKLGLDSLAMPVVERM